MKETLFKILRGIGIYIIICWVIILAVYIKQKLDKSNKKEVVSLSFEYKGEDKDGKPITVRKVFKA